MSAQPVVPTHFDAELVLEPDDGSPLIARSVKASDRTYHLAHVEPMTKVYRALLDTTGARARPYNDLIFTAEFPVREGGISVIRDAAARYGLRLAPRSDLAERSEDYGQAAEWFKLAPKVRDVSACDAPPGRHVIGGMSCKVSPAFVAAVERHGLRGAGFMWRDDASRFETEPWRRIFARAPIGRGVDHPWVDPDRFGTERWARGLLDSHMRKGITTFRLSSVWATDIIDDPLVRDIAQLPGAMQIRVSTVPRYLRRHLPDADFAFHWDMSDGREYPRGNRWRTEVLNRRAFDILKGEGVIDDSDVMPVIVLDELPPQCQDLDRACDTAVLPTYTPEEERQEAEHQEPLYQAWLTKKRHKRIHTVPEAISALLRYRKWIESGAKFEWTSAPSPRAYRALEHELGSVFPHAWMQLLPHLPESFVGHEFARGCELWPPGGFVEWHKRESELSRQLNWDELKGRSLLCFADDGCGNYFAFEVSDPRMPADCRVVEWDHETTSIGMQWDSIPAFVQHMLPDEVL